jgi:polyribonucleotide nucleotidyltransferase
MVTKKKKKINFLCFSMLTIKIEPSPTHLTQSPTYYTTTIEMSSDNDDNRPCGVHPHAQSSWRAKYEYMDRLWIQQQKEIAELQAEKAKVNTMNGKLAVELNSKIAELAKKDMQLQVEIVEKKKVEAEVAELRAQLAKKDTQLQAEVSNINKETEAHRLKLEEAKKTNATKWASCFGCP